MTLTIDATQEIAKLDDQAAHVRAVLARLEGAMALAKDKVPDEVSKLVKQANDAVAALLRIDGARRFVTSRLPKED